MDAELAAHRAAGRRIVFTNGCFDILHAGHVRYLQQARDLGDVLVVAINSDASVRRLKGSGRPVNCEADRASVLAALACVDHVAIFTQDTPVQLVARVRPDVYVKGGDYDEASLPEAAVVRSYGGEVRILPLLAGRSTSAILARMRSS
jgi:rfaE bifunctional protein nucleotidyltransferase chain/domain